MHLCTIFIYNIYRYSLSLSQSVTKPKHTIYTYRVHCTYSNLHWICGVAVVDLTRAWLVSLLSRVSWKYMRSHHIHPWSFLHGWAVSVLPRSPVLLPPLSLYFYLSSSTAHTIVRLPLKPISRFGASCGYLADTLHVSTTMHVMPPIRILYNAHTQITNDWNGVRGFWTLSKLHTLVKKDMSWSKWYAELL